MLGEGEVLAVNTDECFPGPLGLRVGERKACDPVADGACKMRGPQGDIWGA